MRNGLRGEPADVFTDLDQLRIDHGADLVVFTWPHDIETPRCLRRGLFPPGRRENRNL